MNKKPTLRGLSVMGVSAMALSVLAFPAQAIPIVINGSFEDTGTFNASTNITPKSLPGWQTTKDGIGCVHSTTPDTALTQVCGPYRFPNNKFWANPGPSPDRGNYVLIDGDTQTNVSTALYQTLTGLIAGQSYNVSFWQAAAQFTDATGDTTEQWDVSLGGTLPANSTGNFADGVQIGRAHV